MPSDVIVIGAGLIGLSIADELARRGRRVLVLDERAPRATASWAGAGMLTPYPERAGHAGFERLCVRSFELYPAFVNDLVERTGIDCELRIDGLLIAAGDAQAAHRLRARADELRAAGAGARWLDEAAARDAEPALAGELHGALLLADSGQVNNRQLLAALEAACLHRGVTIVRGVHGVQLGVERGRVWGVQTEREQLSAPVVVNAAGAWAGLLPGVPDDAVVPVTPAKGQMLALVAPGAHIRRLAWVDDWYLVPGLHGRLLVGATIEPEAGFDQRVTAGAIHRMLAALLARCPALAGAALAETWAGLRPGTPDGLPYVGATPLDGYLLACGHYRNGIVLAPVTALQVADVLDGRPAAVEPAYTLQRARVD